MLKPLIRLFESFVQPFKPYEERTPPATVGGFYWHYFTRVWPVFVALMLAAAILSVVEVQVFQFLSMIVDLLAKSKPETLWHDHWRALVYMLVVAGVARPVFNLVHDLLVRQTVYPFYTLMRWRHHRYVLRQSLSFFNNDFAGRVASKVMETGGSLANTLVTVFDSLWSVAINFTLTLWLFAHASLYFFAPMLVWLLGYVLMIVHVVPQILKRSKIGAEARSTVLGRMVDSYSNIQTVKLFSDPAREEGYVGGAMRNHLQVFMHQQSLTTGMTTYNYVLNTGLLVSLAALSVWLWSQGKLTLGVVTLTVGLATRIIGLSGAIMWQIAGIFEQIGTVQNGVDTISQPWSVVDAPDAQPLKVNGGALRFDDVRFHYGKGREGVLPALDGLSFDIKPGEKIGIVGPSGAGKSTLVNVFLRLYDLESGRILIDGQDIAHVTQDSLHGAVGVVTQDTALLHRSIRDNVAYGRPDASEDDIRQALRQASADSFVDGLADMHGRTGLDALVGERGVKLSGGQRQRIAIARVLLKNAPILVLDEATSALDSEIEAAIQDSLNTLMRGKTVIAIAHRLSTIARMDRLIVLDKGRIVETGSHAELVKRDGLYARLWARQTGGFLAEHA
ncbi:MAG TPA: ABC transporter ATP-binding protein [Asticcacaulis sp.]|nr:ABC transporter ATP-binding protein [Asticcacaulis sp.]